MKFSNRFRRAWLTFFTALILFSVSRFSHAGEIQALEFRLMADIRWQDVAGKSHHLKESNGKPRLLHFWAAWCIPCRAELPEMLKWQQQNSDILVIPLSLDQRMAQAKYFIKKYELDMPALLVAEADRERLNIPVLPYTIFVAADGSFSGSFSGIAPWGNAAFADQVRQHFALEQKPGGK